MGTSIGFLSKNMCHKLSHVPCLQVSAHNWSRCNHMQLLNTNPRSHKSKQYYEYMSASSLANELTRVPYRDCP